MIILFSSFKIFNCSIVPDTDYTGYKASLKTIPDIGLAGQPALLFPYIIWYYFDKFSIFLLLKGSDIWPDVRPYLISGLRPNIRQVIFGIGPDTR